MCYTTGFGHFIPLFMADFLKLFQTGWRASVNCFLQVSPQILMGVKSGLWLGHSVTFRDLPWTQCSVVVAVWLGSVSCWKVCVHSGEGFLYLTSFIHPSIVPSFSVPASEKHPRSLMLPPPCFTVAMLSLYTVVLLNSDFHLATLPLKAWFMDCCRDGCPSNRFS